MQRISIYLTIQTVLPVNLFQIKHIESMAYYEVKHEDFAAEFMSLVHDGDFCGAGRFLCGIDEQDKKMIVSKKTRSQCDVARCCRIREQRHGEISGERLPSKHSRR